MKANHNYYVNSTESRADATKATTSPQQEKHVVPWHPQLNVCTEPNPVCLLSFSPNMSSGTALPLSDTGFVPCRGTSVTSFCPQVCCHHSTVHSRYCAAGAHLAWHHQHPSPAAHRRATAPTPQRRADPSYRNGPSSSCNLSGNQKDKSTPPYTTQSKGKARYPCTPGNVNSPAAGF